MPHVPIDSLSDPRVADYAQIREAELRKDRFDAPGGLFVAEGELVVRRLLASRYRTRSILTTHARLRTVQDIVDALPAETPVYVVDQPTMNGIVGFNIHRGVLAIGERGPEPDLDQLLRSSRVAVILEDLVNHDNLGGIFRNVAGLGAGCFGETCILLSPKCADPLYRKSIRVSMGSALLVPFARLTDWPNDLQRVQTAGYRVLAMTPSERAVDIDTVTPDASNPKAAILLGSEGPGLTDTAMSKADIHVRIWMPGRSGQSPPLFANSLDLEDRTAEGIDSLNVSVACAIALHRLFPRQNDPN
jgi:tRNA G18 (ribose-2'-O)-methylase SpoU